MTPTHEIEALEVALNDLARGASGRLVGVTLAVPPTTDPAALVEALTARLRAGPLADLSIATRARAGMLRILAAEFARSR
jgi:hypothetical protein